VRRCLFDVAALGRVGNRKETGVVALIIFLVIVIPVVGLIAWLLFDEAFIRIDSGKLGLVVVRGKATDKSLLPGSHFVPVLRRVTVEIYPSLELAYRAGDDETENWSDFEHGGPALNVTLGDRADLDLSYTVRFRLDPTTLQRTHERFGPDGIWSAVRDSSARAVRSTLSNPDVGIDDLFGAARVDLENRLSESLGDVLRADGFELTAFSLGDVDLGRTGAVIQATVRARLELEREQAEAATRRAEVQADLELLPLLGDASMEQALRYREVGVWRQFVQAPSPAAVSPAGALPASMARPPTTDKPVADDEASASDQDRS